MTRHTRGGWKPLVSPLCSTSNSCACVGSVCSADEVALATGRREQLFVLAPRGASPAGVGGSSSGDQLAGMLAGLSVSGGGSQVSSTGFATCWACVVCQPGLPAELLKLWVLKS